MRAAALGSRSAPDPPRLPVPESPCAPRRERGPGSDAVARVVRSFPLPGTTAKPWGAASLGGEPAFSGLRNLFQAGLPQERQPPIACGREDLSRRAIRINRMQTTRLRALQLIRHALPS